MRRLRPSDGTPMHRRAARYHHGRCQRGKATLHVTLKNEIGVLLAALIAKARAAEDASDIEVEAGAAVDAAELDIENAIRELDGELEKLDRKDETLGAQAAVFPMGYGAVIEPDGDEQLEVLPKLHVAVAPFLGEAAISTAMAGVDAAAQALKSALEAEKAAEKVADTAFAEEVAARAAIREQFESAYGRLRAHYKARPALAETFFMKEGGRRAKKEEGGGAGSAPK